MFNETRFMKKFCHEVPRYRLLGTWKLRIPLGENGNFPLANLRELGAS